MYIYSHNCEKWWSVEICLNPELINLAYIAVFRSTHWTIWLHYLARFPLIEQQLPIFLCIENFNLVWNATVLTHSSNSLILLFISSKTWIFKVLKSRLQYLCSQRYQTHPYFCGLSGSWCPSPVPSTVCCKDHIQWAMHDTNNVRTNMITQQKLHPVHSTTEVLALYTNSTNKCRVMQDAGFCFNNKQK